ncbi:MULTISPECIES: efflux RND transporter periplasmic adaptor subunit [unclassified Okeania]|nr:MULTISPECIES: efflux RND transporter periplasmic adaptor subunit [unclassified Okeania]NES75637.1 efflux RND transporter periplasmic adaptor subunit [Okeania sp. SIO1H4]NET19018.1 efflux RND transporter periplasmic adaptor subunit [Okeania sp. SIO1H5]NET91908.1 efflux RND transporter periplasmic adaptor subunit [Okeania sp. SIO1H2]
MDSKLVNQARYWPLLLSVLILSSCGGGTPQAVAPPPTAVEIARVNPTQVADSTEYIAIVEGKERATITPRVSGQVSQVFVSLGNRVKKGDPILQIDPSQQQAVLDSNIAQISSAQAQLDSAEAQLRALRDDKTELIAQRELNSERANLDNAEANLRRERQELNRLLAEFGFLSEEANLENTQATLRSERQELNRLLAESSSLSEEAQLEDAEAALRAQRAEKERREATLEYQKIEQVRFSTLYEEGAVPKERFDQATRDIRQAEAEIDAIEQEIDAAQAQVESAKKDLQRRTGTLDAQIAAQKEVIDAAKAQVESAKKDLQRRTGTLDAQIAAQKEVIDAAKAQVESAKKDLQRRIETLDAQIAAQNEQISSQESQVAQVRGQLQQTQANAVAEQVELQYYNILAPISGVVGEVKPKVGDYVDSQTELTTIQDNNTLEANINIPIDRLPEIRLGTRVELLQQTGQLIGSSRISFISPDTGQGTQTVLVKAIYDNGEKKLQTNQQVKARVIWEEKQGLTVPITSVRRIGDQAFVFVAEEKIMDGEKKLIATQKPVKLGSIQGQDYQVIEGLKSTDKIVVSGVVKLRNGIPIADDSELGNPIEKKNEKQSL